MPVVREIPSSNHDIETHFVFSTFYSLCDDSVETRKRGRKTLVNGTVGNEAVVLQEDSFCCSEIG